MSNYINIVTPISSIFQVQYQKYKEVSNGNIEDEKVNQKSSKNFKEILSDTVIVSKEGKRKMEKENCGQCNHNPNDVNTTLENSKKKVMQFPPQFFMTCKECHKGFRFVKKENGELEEFK